MPESFENVYDDEVRARAYAQLEYPGTYYLAFRDIPELIGKRVHGKAALDFGCGTGRSTRFLKGLGFETVGVDIAAAMLARAREFDPAGEYVLVADGDLSGLGPRRFDLIQCAFTFDNIPGREKRASIMRRLANLLSPDGHIINLVSSPEIYRHEWASFTTAAFPENRLARSGEVVRIVMKDVPDSRPVEDVLWTESDYRALYDSAGLEVAELHRPLGRPADPPPWVSEETVAPWTIYVLAK
jgi:SAM-dependent methyltransferase